MDFQTILTDAVPLLTAFFFKFIGAVAIWVIGRWLIGFSTRVVGRGLGHQNIDVTLIKWQKASLRVTLNIALVVAILGYFGVETTTFAALIAAAGIAIGAAWAGLLANFAAGIFLVILRPFKVGDFIQAGGMTGTVHEMGLFATQIIMARQRVDVYRQQPGLRRQRSELLDQSFRRVDRTAQLNGSVDVHAAIALLKQKLLTVPNVLATPAPDVEILDFTLLGPVLAVRPYTHTNNYWQVYFDTNKLLRDCFGEAGYPAPEQRLTIHQKQG